MSLYPATHINIVGKYGQREVAADNGGITLAASKQGALITEDQVLEWALAGRVFHAQIGNANTPTSFAETAYDEDQPQFALRVPTGRTVLPVHLGITLQDAAGTDTLIAWSTTTNDIGNGTSTNLTISSMRTDAPFSSSCTANSLYTANATAATGLIEFERFLDAFAQEADARNRFVWSVTQNANIPVLVGPATLQMHIHATTTAPAGYVEVNWVEFETRSLVLPA